MKKYRKDEIIKLSRGKRVLHLGFIQHSNLWRTKIKENDWLHSKIMASASYAVGIDYLKDEVEIIKKELGLVAYFGDATNLHEVDLQETFDVIVCGELIEHISNPGLMLDGIKRFMHDESILIITTPNPWSVLWIRHMNSNYNEENWLNKEHVCWYSFQTLKQLLGRHGYRELDYDYYFGESYEKNNISLVSRSKTLIKQMLSFYKKDEYQKNHYEGLIFIAKI